jgi:hypothetical protein
MSDGVPKAEPSKVGRRTDGTFMPGSVPNPKGCPRGSRHKATLLLEKMMADDGAAVVQAVLEAAKGGDMQAARLILDRIAPPRKDRPVVVELPKIDRAADIPQATAAILQATAAGDLTPAEGAALVNIAESHRKAVELADLEARIATLEHQAEMTR